MTSTDYDRAASAMAARNTGRYGRRRAKGLKPVRPLVRVVRIGNPTNVAGLFARPWAAVPARYSWPYGVMPRPCVEARHSWAEAMLDAQHMIHRLEAAQLAQKRADQVAPM